MNDNKLSKKNSEVKVSKQERKYCKTRSLKYVKHNYNKTLRQYNRQCCWDQGT